VPIFDPIIKAVWTHHSPKVALAPPSPEAKKNMVAVATDGTIDEETGQPRAGRFVEYFRTERGGRYKDTQYALISRGSQYSRGYDQDGYPASQYDYRPFSQRPVARDFWSWGGGWGNQSPWGQNSWGSQNAWPQQRQQQQQQPVQRLQPPTAQRQQRTEDDRARRTRPVESDWWSNRQ
jgi:hypothetical protein